MHFASHYRWLVYQHLFGIPGKNTTVLDIGCDDGSFAENIGAKWSIVVDTSIMSLRTVRTGQPICADGTKMPFSNAQFDYVILSDVIEHVIDDKVLIQNAVDCVKPGGTLWISTPAIDFKLFPPQITGRAEHRWGHVRKGYTPDGLRQLLHPGFDCQIVEWPEIAFRHMYMFIWLCAKSNPILAQILTSTCFRYDRRIRATQIRNGHIYMCATRTYTFPSIVSL
jgi:SAM-dependent methyltransferase